MGGRGKIESANCSHSFKDETDVKQFGVAVIPEGFAHMKEQENYVVTAGRALV